MTKALMASVALAGLALAGCTDGGYGSGNAGASAASEPAATVTYAPPPPAPAGSEYASAGGGSNEALCASKGGIVGQWPDVSGSGSTKSCETPDGNGYPLAQLTSFPAFQ